MVICIYIYEPQDYATNFSGRTMVSKKMVSQLGLRVEGKFTSFSKTFDFLDAFYEFRCYLSLSFLLFLSLPVKIHKKYRYHHILNASTPGL